MPIPPPMQSPATPMPATRGAIWKPNLSSAITSANSSTTTLTTRTTSRRIGGFTPAPADSFLVLSAAVSVFAQVTKQERAGITNFSKVDAVVACGGATETSALDGLAKDGFKAVINLRQASEPNANIEQNAARAKELLAGIKP